MLEKRPLSAAYLAKALPLADKAIRALERKRFIVAEQVQTERDPLRAPAERLRIELTGTAPGRQAQQIRARIAGVSRTASRLAQPEGSRRRGEERERRRRGRSRAWALVTLTPETGGRRRGRSARATCSTPRSRRHSMRSPAPSRAKQFEPSCCTASPAPGKTEIYLNAIEAAIAEGRSALLLVPEIALTPAMAGQFFSRFGDRVAILH